MWPADRDCPRLADLEYLVLSAAALASEAYVVAVRLKLREMVGDEESVPPLANVCLALSRLEMKGLCRSYLCDTKTVRGRRLKRLYEVTPEGHAALKHSMSAIIKSFKDGPWN